MFAPENKVFFIDLDSAYELCFINIEVLDKRKISRQKYIHCVVFAVAVDKLVRATDQTRTLVTLKCVKLGWRNWHFVLFY